MCSKMSNGSFNTRGGRRGLMAYVVVGASAAGINGARTLREYNKDADDEQPSNPDTKEEAKC